MLLKTYSFIIENRPLKISTTTPQIDIPFKATTTTTTKRDNKTIKKRELIKQIHLSRISSRRIRRIILSLSRLCRVEREQQ